MLIVESVEKQTALKARVSSIDRFALTRICKELAIPQKTLSVAYYLLYVAKAELMLEPDDIVLISAIINLSSKICETYRASSIVFKHVTSYYEMPIEDSMKKLYNDAIAKTEIDICVLIDFDFEMADLYNRLQHVCKINKFDQFFSKKAWVFLNDIMTTPISAFFNIPEIITSALFLSFIVEFLVKSNAKLSNKEIFSLFVDKYSPECNSFVVIDYISNEMLSMYDHYKLLRWPVS